MVIPIQTLIHLETATQALVPARHAMANLVQALIHTVLVAIFLMALGVVVEV
jgi:hypothetical protein